MIIWEFWKFSFLRSYVRQRSGFAPPIQAVTGHQNKLAASSDDVPKTSWRRIQIESSLMISSRGYQIGCTLIRWTGRKPILPYPGDRKNWIYWEECFAPSLGPLPDSTSNVEASGWRLKPEGMRSTLFLLCRNRNISHLRKLLSKYCT